MQVHTDRQQALRHVSGIPAPNTLPISAPLSVLVVHTRPGTPTLPAERNLASQQLPPNATLRTSIASKEHMGAANIILNHPNNWADASQDQETSAPKQHQLDATTRTTHITHVTSHATYCA
jgi:hypothetical protein